MNVVKTSMLVLWSALPLQVNAQIPWGAPVDSSLTAFVGVNVIPMDGEHVLADQTVIVADGRIQSIGPRERISVSAAARRIDGTGKFLMPGLIDMHAHIGAYQPGSEGRLPALLSLLVANGVTTARSMVGHPTHIALREAIADGTLTGPNLVLAAPQIAGPGAPAAFAQFVVSSVEEAQQRVSAARAAGFDFIKITFALTPELYDAVATAAREAQLPLSGHVTSAIGLERALRAGQQMEHLDSYLEAVVADSSPVKTAASQGAPGAIVRYVDLEKMRRAADATKAAGVAITPTLALFQVAFIRDALTDSFQHWIDHAYMTPAGRQALLQGRAAFWENAAGPALERRLYDQFRMDMTKALSDAGVPLLLGSDSPQQGMMPGFAAHRELAALVEAGLTPYQALVAATRAPAEYLHASADQGTVSVGRRADLLLLDANPLLRIEHTRAIAGVMLGGKWHSKADITQILEQAKP